MTLRLVVISDHHLGSHAHVVNRGYATHWALERVLDAIADAGWHGADALLSTGDLVDVGDSDSYAFARSLFGIQAGGRAPGPLKSQRKGLGGLPIYLVPGNHDPRALWAEELFPETRGDASGGRLHLRFAIKGYRFVFLDLGLGSRAGVLQSDALNVLDAALDEGPTIVVLHHHPVAVGIPWLDRALPEGIEGLWTRLERGVIAILFGHAHTSVDTERAGVPILGTQSTCFQFAISEEPAFMIQPLQYRTLTISPAGVTSERYEVSLTGSATSRKLP